MSTRRSKKFDPDASASPTEAGVLASILPTFEVEGKRLTAEQRHLRREIARDMKRLIALRSQLTGSLGLKADAAIEKAAEFLSTEPA